jgi:hypothetical protein
MPQYRTNEAITYVHDGKVLHADAHKTVVLDEEQAEKLGAKVTAVPVEVGLMFPNGAPVIDALRLDPHHDGANDVKEEPKEKEPAKPEVKGKK